MLRRATVLFSVITAFVAVQPAAGARAPDRFTEHSVEIFCADPLVGSTGVAELFFANVSSEFGAFADVAFWVGQTTPNGVPTLATDFESPGEGSATDSSLSITQPLVDVAAGEPSGVAVISATLTPIGDPQPFAFEDRFGNQVFRSSGTVQPASIEAGSLTIGAETLQLEGCLAQIVDQTIFATQPNAQVFRADDIAVACELTTDDVQGFLFASGDGDGAFVELFFEEPAISGFTDQGVVLSLTTFQATVPMFDTTGEPIGDAVIDASITPGEEFRTKRISQTGFAVGVQQLLSIEGTLSVPTIEESLDLSGCFALRQDVQFIFRNPQGPKPGGTPPANDAPEGAISISVGSTFNTRTDAAALEPEVPASCLTFEEDGEIVQLLGRTVWYTIQGTGAPITIDTAGSRFDTAIAVYTRDDGIFTEVACQDDVFSGQVFISLQSSLTFETEAGVTYFVQIGGFASEFGRLRVSVR